MDNFHERHDGLINCRRRVEVADNSLKHFGRRGRLQNFQPDEVVARIQRLVKARHVNSANTHQAAQEASTPADFARRLPRSERLDDLAENFFSLADDKEVEKFRDGLDIVNARSAADNEGLVVATLRRVQMNLRQVQHVEDVCINHFVLQGKSQHVEFADGAF